MNRCAVTFALLLNACATPHAHVALAPAGNAVARPVSTYSIVARDPRTGEMGVAVQSHWFGVGSVVPWAEAGVGAVATQSLVDPSYGPLGLQLMKAGRPAPDALRGLLEADQGREVRQVAMVDATGRVAAHTGAKCIDMAGQFVNEPGQFSVQANLMEKDTVWGAMAAAYQDAPAGADLAERMLLALEAAEREGGDIRGKQSAALLIVGPTSTGKQWIDRKFDLRVEDHPTPLAELRRLVQVQRAYNHMNAGDLALEKGDMEAAMREHAAAERFAPQIVEIPFWHAVTLVNNGKLDEALPIFRSVFEREPKWAELVPRLVKAGLLRADDDAVQRIAFEVVSGAIDRWRSMVGQTIVVEGTALNAKFGGLIECKDVHFWLDHAAAWPTELYGRKVRVTGRLVERSDLPVMEMPEDRKRLLGGVMYVPKGTEIERAKRRFVIEQPRWELLE